MGKQSVLWLLYLLCLTGCDTLVTAASGRADFDPAAYYYLLNEKPPRVVEINRYNKREQRTYILSNQSLGKETPEGLAYISNQDVVQYGFFGLSPSEHGGYFLVAAQRSATLHVFELPLLSAASRREVQSLRRFNIPGLEKDASDLFYAKGEIWLTVARTNQLFRLGTTADENDLVAVTAVYDLSGLPHNPADIEGVTFSNPETVFLAEDRPQRVTRYDNFPACLAEESCQPAWSHVYGELEPSGAIWHDRGRELLIVDDEGALMRFDPESGADELIMYTSLDLEAITLVPSLP